jgi:hypothetical protein
MHHKPPKYGSIFGTFGATPRPSTSGTEVAVKCPVEMRFAKNSRYVPALPENYSQLASSHRRRSVRARPTRTWVVAKPGVQTSKLYLLPRASCQPKCLLSIILRARLPKVMEFLAAHERASSYHFVIHSSENHNCLAIMFTNRIIGLLLAATILRTKNCSIFFHQQYSEPCQFEHMVAFH